MEGLRIALCPLERKHLAKAQEWVNREEIREYLANVFPLNEAAEEKWLQSLTDNRTQIVFAVHEKETGEHVGTCGLHAIDWVNRVGEFGIALGVPNKGFGTEATRLVLRYAFETLNLNRVQLRVYEYNARAVRCYEKAGYRHEGRLRQAMFRRGRTWDVLMMSVLAEEWRANETR